MPGGTSAGGGGSPARTSLRPSDLDLLTSLASGDAPAAVLAGSNGNPSAPSNGYTQNTDDPNLIIIRGAQQHNLKHVNISIPRNKLVVLTGVSGSGKSSLAFDTLYAEGQRRYVEPTQLVRAPLPRPDG